MIKISGVYCIKNKINNKCYIGITHKEIEKRWKEHIKVSENPNNKNYRLIHKAINKYGVDNFDFIKLVEFDYCTDEMYELFKQLEILYIEKYDSIKNGYNLTEGGQGTLGFKLSEEQKQHLSNINKGKKLSAEHRDKISFGLKYNSNWRLSEEGYKNLKERSCKETIVFYLDTGEIYKTFKSQKECGDYYNLSNKKVSQNCNKRGLVFGYINDRPVGVTTDKTNIQLKLDRYKNDYSERHNTKKLILQE